MKTNAQIDEDLAHVSDMIESLLKAHSMTLLADDIVTPINLEHRQLVDGKMRSRSLELELIPF